MLREVCKRCPRYVPRRKAKTKFAGHFDSWFCKRSTSDTLGGSVTAVTGSATPMQTDEREVWPLANFILEEGCNMLLEHNVLDHESIARFEEYKRTGDW